MLSHSGSDDLYPEEEPTIPVQKGDSVFGWFRKRRHPEGDATSTTDSTQPTPQHAAVTPPALQQQQLGSIPAPIPAASAPSARPAMPLGGHPNFSGLERPGSELEPPRLLEPTAIMSDEAREELTLLLDDMFGAEGRYRLEWRPDREPGDDAMFSEIMVADLVRRIQNTLGTVAALEAGEEAPARLAPVSEQERQRAIETFLKPEESLEDLVETVTPRPADIAARASVTVERKIA